MMPEDEFRRFVAEHGFSIANLSYRCNVKDKAFEYETVIRARDPGKGKSLSEALCKTAMVHEFQLSPMAD